ncbi:MAG: tRNA lysidine(34) synthetase TilS [Desulfatibacillum sp.]|nr:tRNA lysidine(34) synthetase TilS [Desulfatibacillum sp.]
MTKGHIPPGGDLFLEKVRSAIREHRMFQHGARVLVGVSGGPDSAALLHALTRLKKEFALSLGVAHVNHCLRGAESDKDALFAGSLAKAYGLPFFLKTTDVAAAKTDLGLSLEETARITRRDFFSFLRKEQGYKHVALGHHADDNAEWMLLSLIRGAGAGGLSGIPPVNHAVVRPLFNFTRQDILDYCQKNSLSWVLDSSNNDLSILRNQIRHHLLPLLADQYNPSITGALNRLSEILRTEHQWMDGMASDFLDQWFSPARDGFAIPLDRFREQPLPLQRRIILQAMARTRGNTRKTTWTHVRDILKICAPEKTDGQIHLPDGLEARRIGEILEFVLHPDPDWAHTPTESFSRDWEMIIEGPGIYPIPRTGATITCTVEENPVNPVFGEDPREACLDLDTARFPLVLRPWQPGDRFVPLGTGGGQKVKKFLGDHKIPAKDRPKICVLSSGGTIVWIVGQRLAETAKVRPKTRRIVRCKVLLA